MQPAQRVLTNLHELSDAELLSILLWGGTRQTEINAAYSLLQKVNGDLMMLRRHSTQELRAMGLDDRTIAKLRALIEMENRLAVPTYQDIEAITSPNHAAKMMMVRLRGQGQGRDSRDVAGRRPAHPGHRHRSARPAQHRHGALGRHLRPTGALPRHGRHRLPQPPGRTTRSVGR